VQVAAVKALGGMVRLVGDSYTETQSYAWQAAVEEKRAFIAPYDDPLTIAGQGTIGVEILKQLGSNIDELEAVFVPVGGGGLLAGIAAYIKALKPSVKLIGVEPTGANCMAQSLARGQRVQLSRVDPFADGVAVKSVGAVRSAHGCLFERLLAVPH
jgi:threonine dehydratase